MNINTDFREINPYDETSHGDPLVDRERLLECADVVSDVWLSSPSVRAYLEAGGYSGLIRGLDVMAQVNVSVRVEMNSDV